MIHLVAFLALSVGTVKADMLAHTFDTAADCQKFIGTPQFYDDLKVVFTFYRADPDKTPWMVNCVRSKEQQT